MSPDFFRDGDGTHSADTLHDTDGEVEDVENTSENVEDGAKSQQLDNDDNSQQVPIHVNNDDSQDVPEDNVHADSTSHERPYSHDNTQDVEVHDDHTSYVQHDSHETTHENANNANHAQPDGSPMTTVSRDDDADNDDDGYFHGDDGSLYQHSEM